MKSWKIGHTTISSADKLPSEICYFLKCWCWSKGGKTYHKIISSVFSSDNQGSDWDQS